MAKLVRLQVCVFHQFLPNLSVDILLILSSAFLTLMKLTLLFKTAYSYDCLLYTSPSPRD